jgi:hypothetical protein
MENNYKRRTFIKAATLTGIGITLGSIPTTAKQATKRVGIIGLDTSHSVAFTKVLNASEPDAAYKGYRVVAAYPQGSRDIESSTKRVPGYIEETWIQVINATVV